MTAYKAHKGTTLTLSLPPPQSLSPIMADTAPPPVESTAHTSPSLAFDQCTLTPAGISVMVDHLRCFPPFRDLPMAPVRAAAIALIAFGGPSGGKHRTSGDGLHDADFATQAPSIPTTWQSGLHEEYTKLVMDLLAWKDRISGGASFLVSTQATRRPGTLPSITEVKMDTFLPKDLLREHPKTSITFARMVQHFAEEIGLLAMQRYDKAKSHGRKGAVVTIPTRSHVDTHPLIPLSDSMWHTFYGRDSTVLQRLISEQLAIIDTQGASSTPRPLPPLPVLNVVSPALSSTPTAESSVTGSDDLLRTTEDIKHYAARMENLEELDDVGRRSILDQISTRLPDIFSLILSLEHRTRDLELINTTQTEEIEGLRTTLQDVIDDRGNELTLIKEQLKSAFTESPTPPPSSRTFGHPDKEPMPSRRPRVTTLDSSLSPISPATETPSPSMFEPRRVESCTTPTSSVAFLSVPPPSRSSSRSPSAYTSTPSDTYTSSHSMIHAPWKMYGPHTDYILSREGLPRRLHRDFKFIEDNHSVDDWVMELGSRIKVQEGLAKELVKAMKFDCGLLSCGGGHLS
uniref:N/A n=1 Tax=Ganoderma boninense TaxID=34458 RepID=A0A5K1K450_9APHY|nr:N/A [Ganoderma boninense]